MTDKERSRELTRSSFAAQMAMLGYEPNGNPKDMVEVVRCKNCKWFSEKGFCKHPNGGAGNIRSGNWFCADGDMIETNQESAEDVTGLYCDDITFCWGPCDKFKCPRNKYNIRDKRVPHSFFAEGVVPDDCPKQKEKENR